MLLQLPIEIIQLILQNFTGKELMRIRTVCRTSYNAIRCHKRLFRRILFHKFNRYHTIRLSLSGYPARIAANGKRNQHLLEAVEVCNVGNETKSFFLRIDIGGDHMLDIDMTIPPGQKIRRNFGVLFPRFLMKWHDIVIRAINLRTFNLVPEMEFTAILLAIPQSVAEWYELQKGCWIHGQLVTRKYCGLVHICYGNTWSGMCDWIPCRDQDSCVACKEYPKRKYTFVQR